MSKRRMEAYRAKLSATDLRLLEEVETAAMRVRIGACLRAARQARGLSAQ